MKIPILPLSEKTVKMDLGHLFINELNRLGKLREPFLFIIDFEGINPLVYPLSGIPEGILFALPGYPAPGVPVPGLPNKHLETEPVPFEVYLQAFQLVMEHLRKGNSYLVNLTMATPVKTSLGLEDIFHRSDAPYRLLVGDRFVVFSPEPFIRIQDNRISSFPMKGTIDASLPDAAIRVLSDPKESAEHTTIVDLIRNDLSRVSSRVEVARYRYIQRLRTRDRDLLQVSSEIRGLLPENWQDSVGTILNALLPAGSVSGAPKPSTLRIIREAEAEPRGYYTGVFGVFNGTGLDSAVMIRFIEQDGNSLRYRSGGGITHLSDARTEYNEMLQKVYLPFV